MELNVLIRGQSNAWIFAEWGGGAASALLRSEVERLLGFDGVNDRVNLLSSQWDGTGGTLFGGTTFLREWISPIGGDWQQGWNVSTYEGALLNWIRALPADTRDNPTAILWLHSEFDSMRSTVTAQEWMSGARFEADLVRDALGLSAGDSPYLFVSAHPFPGTDEGHQAIRLGMEGLAADLAFNGHIAARALDINADLDDADGNPATREYGGWHMSLTDASTVALRSARSIAEAFASHAKPGSPLAVAGGSFDDEGPRVVFAEQIGASALRLTVRHDGATGFLPLDPDAAAGVGWSVHGPGDTVWRANSASVESASTVLLTFAEPLPADGVLFYGYGIGRLAGAAGEGRGNAIYDSNQMPIWVAAQGLPVGLESVSFVVGRNGQTSIVDAVRYAGPVTRLEHEFLGSGVPEVVIGTARNDFIHGFGGDDAIDGGAGSDVLDGGTGSNFMTGGTGAESFFLDGRGLSSTWSTIVDWDEADELAVWGWMPGVSRSGWVENAGAAGYQGATLHTDLDGNGGIDTSVTFTGRAVASIGGASQFDGLLWFQ